jgi:hypothetical protein
LGQMSFGQMSFEPMSFQANVSGQMSLGKCRMGKRRITTGERRREFTNRCQMSMQERCQGA